jgi:DNA-binding NtrC family response regulator
MFEILLLFGIWHATGLIMTNSSDISNRSVLVVDDDARMLRALEKVLKSEGLDVTCADWGGDVVDILTARNKQIDLVITDIRMPLFTGMTLVYAIRQIFPKMPIIVLTAFGNPEIRAECLRQGASAFLEKPLDSQDLLRAVKDALFSGVINAESPAAHR